MKKLFVLFAIAASAFALAACDEVQPSAASRESHATQVLANQAAVTVGMPAIKNFSEKRQLKAIYELRDTANLVTYTYTLDINGKRHKVCPATSVGFGMPYATQYTAPKGMALWQLQNDYAGVANRGIREADQPEPNGLYMPTSADGTWVICLNPKTGEMAPTYVEPRVVTYTFEMPSVD